MTGLAIKASAYSGIHRNSLAPTICGRVGECFHTPYADTTLIETPSQPFEPTVCTAVVTRSPRTSI